MNSLTFHLSEDYAITERESIATEMKQLSAKLEGTANFNIGMGSLLEQLENEFKALKEEQNIIPNITFSERCTLFENILGRINKIASNMKY